MRQNDIVILDYETELIGDYGDLLPRIIEIGAIRVSCDLTEIKGEFESYVNPGRKVKPRHKAKLENIDRKKIMAGPEWPEAYEEFKEFAAGADIAAWPAAFEEWVTNADSHRHDFRPKRVRYICIRSQVSGFAELLGVESRGYGADSMCQAFNVKKVLPDHRSINDCKTFLKLWKKSKGLVAAKMS